MSDRQEHDEHDDRWNGDNRRKWTVKREIPIATVIALLVALMPIVGAGINLYTRVSLLEQEEGQMNRYNRQQDADRQMIRNDIKDELRDINRKIDKLTQRLLDGNPRTWGDGDAYHRDAAVDPHPDSCCVRLRGDAVHPPSVQRDQDQPPKRAGALSEPRKDTRGTAAAAHRYT